MLISGGRGIIPLLTCGQTAVKAVRCCRSRRPAAIAAAHRRRAMSRITGDGSTPVIRRTGERMEEEDLVPIGEAARRAGLNASALRYYEQRGIIVPDARHEATRMYGPDQLRRLAFIQAGRRLGMSPDDIAGFLHGPPHRWRGIIRARIAALEEQIRQAERARDYLGWIGERGAAGAQWALISGPCLAVYRVDGVEGH
jgi:DNA-binding transcriptional MerR regulator